MKKTVIGILFIASILSATNAFAQFKNPVKTVKNLMNLERVVSRAAKHPMDSRQIIKVPAGIIENNKVALTTPVLNRAARYTPVMASLVKYINSLAAVRAKTIDGYSFLPSFWVMKGGQALYRDQASLTDDLKKFYEDVDSYVSADGREVKLYALPVDGILYKPAGYNKPVVLNAQDYFVIYDVASQTGKIAENRPEIYNVFKPRVYDEIWSGMRLWVPSKRFGKLNDLCNAILSVHLHKALLDEQHTDYDTADIVQLILDNAGSVSYQLNHPDLLLKYLKQMPQARQIQTGYTVYLVELPVDGLIWKGRFDTHQRSYNRREHVMLFFETGEMKIYPRTDVENPKFFQPVKPVTPHANNNSAWLFYKAEKFAWITDRKGAWFETLWNFGYPRHFASQKALGEALDSFHRQKAPSVYDKLSHQISYVYEIPVKHLTCVVDGKPMTIDPEEYVFLYNAQTGGKLVKRADLENANLYKFLDK